ncbi:MAG: efflux RND transporter periplasmic adaptor subunit [Betaproteobacteria bacterium]
MSRAKWTVLLLTVAGLLLAYAGLQLWSGPRIKLLDVSVGDMVQTIVASGHVQNPNRIEITAQITSTVESVAVSEGQQVTKGQLLLTLDSQEARAGLQLAMASVEEARSHLRQLKEVSEPVAALSQLQAEANLKINERNLARSRELYDKAFVGEAAMEEPQRQVILARSQALINKKQWLSLQDGGSDMLIAQSALKQALANVDTAKARLTYTRILAPRSGVLISRNVEAGDGVQAGKQLLVLSPVGQSELVVQLDEKNMKWVHTGQAAIASADAFPDQLFPCSVSFINPGIDALRGSVEVKLKVLEVPGFLTQDMTVTVDIEVNKKSNAMQVPWAAVHDADKAQSWVLTLQNGKAVKTPVTPGMRGSVSVEIVSGLKATDQLVPVSETGIHEGSHLRALVP